MILHLSTPFAFAAQEAATGKPTVLRGVIVCQVGEAKGHGYHLDQAFCDQVVECAKGQAVKVRLDHPAEGETGKVLSIVGKASNFRIDGDKVRADVELFDVPASTTLQKLAQQAADLFGMSLDFAGKVGKEIKDGLKTITCQAINALDFVEAPAATSALFAAQVDSTAQDNPTAMKVTLTSKILGFLKLGEKPEEKDIIAKLEAVADQPDPEKAKKDQETKMAEAVEAKGKEVEGKLAALRAKLAEHEDGEALCAMFDEVVAGKGADADHDEPDGDEVLDAKVSKQVKRLVARQFSQHLAAAGIRRKPVDTGAPGGDDPAKGGKGKDEDFGLSADQLQICKDLDIEPKQFAANLKSAQDSIRI